jgi:hypothetical protein
MKFFLPYLFLHTDYIVEEGQISGTGVWLNEVWLKKAIVMSIPESGI